MPPAKVISTRIDEHLYERYRQVADRINLRPVIEAALEAQLEAAEHEDASGSFWDSQKLSQKVRKVLRKQDGWVTTYQLVFLLMARYPALKATQPWPLGGRGSGTHHTWASYVGGTLVKRHEAGLLPDIEYNTLSTDYLTALDFDFEGKSYHASLNWLTLFRIKPT